MQLSTLIDNQQLHSVFQPIVDTYRSVVLGYESLIRGPDNHPLQFPGAIFTQAEREHSLEQLERHCAETAIRSFEQPRFQGTLFINMNPNVLALEPTVQQFLKVDRDIHFNVVIELSEQQPVSNLPRLKAAVHTLRTAGYRFAIDDLGAGHSSMKLWAEIRPEYVKIDRYFVQDIHKNPYKREFVQHIVTLAKNLHAIVIAEGIESIDELRQLQRIGIYAMQGFLIGKPSLQSIHTEELRNLIHHEVDEERYDSLHALIEETTVVTPHRKVADVLDYFQQNKRLVAIPVVEQGRVEGIIRRGQFMELMSSNFGRALYANKPAASVMHTNYLMVDVHAPLEQASSLLTEHEDTLEHQVLLIKRLERYAGIIPVPSLLRRITELRIQNARYANPLTLLPGNVPINQTIDRCALQNLPFCVLYFDLNNFKPYNDVYGYHQGDAVIQWFAQLLRDTFFTESCFVGHVGGDDFIVVLEDSDLDSAQINGLKHRFNKEIRTFYRDEHLEAGAILARARDGRFQRFSLLDFSLGIVHVAANAVHSHQQVAAMASNLKLQAKRNRNGVATLRCA